MGQGEAAIVNGTGSQTGGGNRWGDYTDSRSIRQMIAPSGT